MKHCLSHGVPSARLTTSRHGSTTTDTSLAVQRSDLVPIVGAEAKFLSGKRGGCGELWGASGDNADPGGPKHAAHFA